MELVFFIGLLGSLVLVTGAALPDSSVSKHPERSWKNYFLALGGVIMLLFAFLDSLEGAPFFFVILEILVCVASVLMFLNTPDRFDAAVLISSGLGLIVWTLFLFEGYTTVIFIIGLCIMSLGYAFQGMTLRRSIALACGGAIIAIFSYLESSWIFFWLNTFFSCFSTYHVVRIVLKRYF